MYLITTIIILVIISAIWLTLRKGVEAFASEVKGDIIVPPVDYGLAMKEIGDNLAREKKIITSLVPYYEKLVGIAAGNKIDSSKYKTKEEMKAVADRERPSIRASIEKEEPGRVLPLYDINRALNTISSVDRVADEVKYFVSYMYLPLEVVTYKTTAEFLNIKCIDVYKFLANLGGPNSDTAKVRGSSAESLGVTVSGFQDINISSTSIKAKGNLQDILSQYTVKLKEQSLNIGPEDIQQLYRISKTRILKLEELKLGPTIFKELVENFTKLNQLIAQLEKADDKTYAAVIADGKTPEEALSAFTDYADGFANGVGISQGNYITEGFTNGIGAAQGNYVADGFANGVGISHGNFITEGFAYLIR